MTPSFPVYTPTPSPRRTFLTEVGRLWMMTCICLVVALGAFTAGYAKARRDLDAVMSRYRECCEEGARLRSGEALPRRRRK